MEKIFFWLLLATEWAIAIKGLSIKSPSLPRQDNVFHRRAALTQENRDNRFNELENKVEKLLNNHRSKDIRHRAMEAALASLVLESTVDCGPPTPVEGADVVYRSTVLNAMASYKCKEGFFNIYPGEQMMSFCQNDGQWSMVSVKCASKSKDKRINDLENKVVELLIDKKNKDIRLRKIETALEFFTNGGFSPNTKYHEKYAFNTQEECINKTLTSNSNLTELSVDCGSPTPPEGTDVVYSSTGLHAIVKYRCKKGFLDIYPGQQMTSMCQKDGQWTMVNEQCVNISRCWTAPAGVALYAGIRSTTTTGKVCQRWDSQTPHNHRFKEDAQFTIPGFDIPQTITGSVNYCRDPSHAGFLWCYTTDKNSRWEKCDVAKCTA